MTQLYDPSIATQITEHAQNYILNFDLNSLYSHTIVPAKIIHIDETGMQFTKQNYQHFLRLNNRRRTHWVDDMKTAGYSYVQVQWRWGDDPYPDYQGWIRDNCKLGSVVYRNNLFWFAYEEDALAFKMSWL